MYMNILSITFVYHRKAILCMNFFRTLPRIITLENTNYEWYFHKRMKIDLIYCLYGRERVVGTRREGVDIGEIACTM